MSEPVISGADVVRVAALARLALRPDEVDRFTAQLADVLGHAAEVSALDTGDVVAMAHPFDLTGVMRADEPRPGVDRDEVLAQAPAAEHGRFRVPGIGVSGVS